MALAENISLSKTKQLVVDEKLFNFLIFCKYQDFAKCIKRKLKREYNFDIGQEIETNVDYDVNNNNNNDRKSYY